MGSAAIGEIPTDVHGWDHGIPFDYIEQAILFAVYTRA